MRELWENVIITFLVIGAAFREIPQFLPLILGILGLIGSLIGLGTVIWMGIKT